MSRIVEDLLTLAHMDAERPLELAPVDVADLVTTAVGAAARPHLTGQCDYPSRPFRRWTQIKADSTRSSPTSWQMLFVIPPTRHKCGLRWDKKVQTR